MYPCWLAMVPTYCLNLFRPIRILASTAASQSASRPSKKLLILCAGVL